MIRTLRPLLCVLSLAAMVQTSLGAEDVAIATEVQGRCTHQAGGDAPRDIAAYDWLPAGAVVVTTPGSSLVLSFANGKRWRLEAGAAVTLEPAGISRPKGPVMALADYPPFPRVEAPAAHARPGGRAAALRIRGGRIRGLYPRYPATLRPEEALFTFEAVPGAEVYRVEVEDFSGHVVFQAEATAPTFTVSAGILKPGGRYFWRVRSLGNDTPARGEAEFIVPPAEALAARAALDRELGAARPEAAGLLAEIDRGLGLWREAHTRLQSALERAAGDRGLEELLSRVEAGLAALDEER